MEKSYKQFTVLRLVAILRYMNIKPKYLEDLYRNIKLKKPNIYVETLSRTMLKVNNYHEVIDVIIVNISGFLTHVPRKDTCQIDIARQNSLFVIQRASATQVLAP